MKTLSLQTMKPLNLIAPFLTVASALFEAFFEDHNDRFASETPTVEALLVSLYQPPAHHGSTDYDAEVIAVESAPDIRFRHSSGLGSRDRFRLARLAQPIA